MLHRLDCAGLVRRSALEIFGKLLDLVKVRVPNVQAAGQSREYPIATSPDVVEAAFSQAILVTNAWSEALHDSYSTAIC